MLLFLFFLLTFKVSLLISTCFQLEQIKFSEAKLIKRDAFRYPRVEISDLLSSLCVWVYSSKVDL